MNILKAYLKKYSITRLSEITGISVEVLKMYKENKLSVYIQSLPDGGYAPTRKVFVSNFKSKMKKHINKSQDELF